MGNEASSGKPSNGKGEPTRADRISQAIANDPRYPAAAFKFVADAVPTIAAELAEQDKGHRGRRHITGKELCMGLRKLLLREYGRMAIDVLNAWHVTQSIDFGEIVYGLVDAGVLSVSPEDSREDFIDVFDFNEAFVKRLTATGPVKPMPVIFDMTGNEAGQAAARGLFGRRAPDSPCR